MPARPAGPGVPRTPALPRNPLLPRSPLGPGGPIWPGTPGGPAAAEPGFPGAPGWPSWPAGSPWVTAVGATRFVDDRVAALAPQAAVAAEDGFGSGGGFSWNFDRPDYQKAAVEGYLKQNAKKKALR